MVTAILAGWLIFTLGIALERSRARRSALFVVLWLAQALLLVVGYWLGGLAEWF